MKKRWGFFPYRSLRYKAAQAYLDRKATQGWELKGIHLGYLACFERTKTPQHFVDLVPWGSPTREASDDYLALCGDAGWEYIQSLRGMLLFRAAEGAHPVPLQSDQEIEWDQFWEVNRPRLRNTVVLLLALALMATVLLISPPSAWKVSDYLMNNGSLALLLFWGLSLVLAILDSRNSKRYLTRCREMGRVEAPGRLGILLDHGEALQRLIVLPLLALILIGGLLSPAVELRSSPFEAESSATVEACGAYPVVRGYDLGFPDTERGYSRYLTQKRSLLANCYDYSELLPQTESAGTIILTTERYDCAGEALAQWLLNQRRRETAGGAFLWGELDWQEAPRLGFEESYTCQEGSYLLVRQGKVVALVGCSGTDLTTAEHLTIVRERLGL